MVKDLKPHGPASYTRLLDKVFRRFAQVYPGGPSSGQADPSGQGLTIKRYEKTTNDKSGCANPW